MPHREDVRFNCTDMLAIFNGLTLGVALGDV